MGTKPTKSDLPQGMLDLLILKIVALGPVHGYSIAQRLQQVSRDVVQVPQGSLYPALHRLENRGLLAAGWDTTESGRDAKFYRLTKKGRGELEAQTESWRRLTAAIGSILRLSHAGAEGTGGGALHGARRSSVSSTKSFASTSSSMPPISPRTVSIRLKRCGGRGSIS